MKKEHQEAAADPAAIEQELKTIEAALEKGLQGTRRRQGGCPLCGRRRRGEPGLGLAPRDCTSVARRWPYPIPVGSEHEGDLRQRSGRRRAVGRAGITRGHYAIDTIDPATKQPRTDTGSYLTVWKKQADGSWKAVEDFVTPGAPPAANSMANSRSCTVAAGMTEPVIRVGIGGWTYEPWRGTFYPDDLPQKRELEYAARSADRDRDQRHLLWPPEPEELGKLGESGPRRLPVRGQGLALSSSPGRSWPMPAKASAISSPRA